MDYQQLLKKSDEEHKKTYTNDIYTPSKEESRKDSLSMDDIRYQYSNMKKKHIETSIIEQNMLKKKHTRMGMITIPLLNLFLIMNLYTKIKIHLLTIPFFYKINI